MRRATVSVIEASKWLGVSRNSAYEQIRQTDSLAGIPVIRILNRIVIPAEPLRAKLGLDEESNPDDE